MHIPAASTPLPWKVRSDIYEGQLMVHPVPVWPPWPIPTSLPQQSGVQAPPHWVWSWFATTWLCTCHLTMDFPDCQDSELTLAASPADPLPDALCSAKAEPAEQKRSLQIYSLFRGWSGESQLTQDGAPLLWSSGIMVSPQRFQESAVGTVISCHSDVQSSSLRKLPGSNHSSLVMCHSRDTQVLKRQGDIQAQSNWRVLGILRDFIIQFYKNSGVSPLTSL